MNATIWLVTKEKSIYTFIGNGNWSIAANWQNNKIPPAILPAGDDIIIAPAANGQCMLNITQHIAIGATITIAPGKNLIVPGVLTIQ
jgi:hypothetical protein